MAEFNYGGQAVIEGVMIRGQKTAVTAVRRPGGEVVTDTRPLHSIYTGWLRKTPFLRGIIVLLESLVLGVQSLMYSANTALEDEEESISGAGMWLILGVSMAIAVGFFFLVPLFVTNLLGKLVESSIAFNLIEGVIRLGLFLGYLKLISLMPDIKRVFAYHGAEHKTVNAYESGVPLEVPNVQRYSTAHPRCGTSFLFVVLVIAIVVFTLIGKPAFWLMVVSRIVLVPVIAALGYEVIYFGARHNKNPIVKAIIMPGMWLQSMTTREPDDTQIEVALAALNQARADDIAEAVPAAGPGTSLPSA